MSSNAIGTVAGGLRADEPFPGAVVDGYFPATWDWEMKTARGMRADLREMCVRGVWRMWDFTSSLPEYRFPELEIELADGPVDGEFSGGSETVAQLIAENGDDPDEARKNTWDGPMSILRWRCEQAGYDQTVGCQHERGGRCHVYGDWPEPRVPAGLGPRAALRRLSGEVIQDLPPTLDAFKCFECGIVLVEGRAA